MQLRRIRSDRHRIARCRRRHAQGAAVGRPAAHAGSSQWLRTARGGTGSRPDTSRSERIHPARARARRLQVATIARHLAGAAADAALQVSVGPSSSFTPPRSRRCPGRCTRARLGVDAGRQERAAVTSRQVKGSPSYFSISMSRLLYPSTWESSSIARRRHLLASPAIDDAVRGRSRRRAASARREDGCRARHRALQRGLGAAKHAAELVEARHRVAGLDAALLGVWAFMNTGLANASCVHAMLS